MPPMPASYVPKPRPKATDLAAYATIYDAASFTPEIRARWRKAAKHDVVASYLTDIGVMRAVEVAGDLHVHGNFDTAAHGIAALYVHGDLVVDGVYTDPSYPQTVVLVGGALRAKTIVTGAHLEVRGQVTARHLAGDYNDYVATFSSGVEAATFFPENHHFALAKKPTFQLVIGESAPHRVPAAIRKSLEPPPDGGLDAFLARGLVSEGELDTKKLYAALRAGKDILAAGPGSVDPDLAAFPPGLRAKLATPDTVTTASLKNRKLTAIPARLLGCTNLTSLDLEDNTALTNLKGLSTFTNLRKLNLDSTAVASLDELRPLTNLHSLSMRYTKQLKALPDWLPELAALSELWLTASALSKFPRILTKLPALKKLWVWHWFDINPAFLADAIATIGTMKLTHVGLLQGALKRPLPADLSPLRAIANVDLIDLGLSAGEKARLQEAVPHVQTLWPNQRVQPGAKSAK